MAHLAKPWHLATLLFATGAALAEAPLPVETEPPILSVEDFIAADPRQAALGRLLFYDPILSGNRNISCGTCHHHDHAGTDGLSLGIGEGGVGVGPDRHPGEGPTRIAKRVPRNAPALWNLGHASIHTLFRDGRLSVSDLYGNGFDSPAEEFLPEGLDNILAAQALFPLTAEFEMAGQVSENEVAAALRERIDMGWPILAARIRDNPEYRRLFADAFDIAPGDITIVHVANAIAAFEISEWQSFDSPYDAWLNTGAPLPPAADRGRTLFFGAAGCVACHGGPLFTDQGFRALGLPAFGPGRTRLFDPIPRDVGRMGTTDLLEDAYRFRTPSLRNVALTAPYGHNGAYPTLEAMIAHHADPETARAAWTPDIAALPPALWLAATDFAILQDARETARLAAARDIAIPPLDAGQIDDLAAFLQALTGVTAAQRPLGRPARVPSGLPVD